MDLTREQIIEELQRLRMELDSIPRTPAIGSSDNGVWESDPDTEEEED